MPVLLQADSIPPRALHFMAREHLDEIDLINRLYEILQHELLMSIIYPEAVQCLRKLIRATRIHFDHEEQLMREKHYPGFITHRDKHTAFMQLLQDAHDHFVATRDKKKLLDFMEQVLKDWFIDHLRSEDFQLAKFSQRQHT